jgi:repressor LexA
MSTATHDLSSPQLKTYRALRRYIDEHGFPPTVGELADQLQKTKATVHNHLHALIDLGYLRRTVGKARSLEILGSPTTTVIDVVSVPILGDVPAGNPVAAEQQHVGEVQVEGSLVGGQPCFALRVVGDSMMDADILDGDMLIVRQQPLATDRDIVVAAVDGEVTVKRLHLHNGRMQLIPENKQFRPLDITSVNEFRILGKVIATRRIRKK